MDLELLKNFYLGEEPEVETLFDMWERGEARDDSITPSAFCPEYRAWMVQRIHRLLHTTGGRDVLSVGCGNGFIEAELHKAGLSVLAIDVMPVAVRLARRKGVNAVVGDARRWRPPHEHWDLIYADGLLGHLIEPA
jgi:protein-L-isoaspartate O-methyltransferase